jgi:hypothetical protein
MFTSEDPKIRRYLLSDKQHFKKKIYSGEYIYIPPMRVFILVPCLACERTANFTWSLARLFFIFFKSSSLYVTLLAAVSLYVRYFRNCHAFMNCTCICSRRDINRVICLTTQRFVLRLVTWILNYSYSGAT